ncbi:hypothetical protein [Algiphilus aromaticivorans]|uniref:hypothetical protein n=1 Tax=Algiphilus aromaticivorans TaxID=382454 RepID=UPI0005C1EA0E|nr:hypothetical protein [Algiphilus aromaticivorans]
MSERKPPHPGDIYARERANVAALKAAYPHQFPEPYWAYGWPDGWHRLVVEACAGLARHSPQGHWLQIKEKFGGLRLYYDGGPLRLDLQAADGVHCIAFSPGGGLVEPTDLNALISGLEKASRETCCLCGGVQGTGRAVCFSGWWLTACETCEPLIRAHRALPPGER